MLKNRLHRWLLTVLILVVFGSGLVPAIPSWLPKADAATQTFITAGSSSWQAPTNVSTVLVEAWGGGGGGAGRTTSGQSGGGGGGAYASKLINVTSGAVYTYSVGAGGTTSTSTAGNGGNTQWSDGSEILAAGGKAGTTAAKGGTGGLASASIGTTVFSGGTGGNSGVSSSGGGGGGGAGPNAAGTTSSGAGGGSAQADGGAGGSGGSNGIAGTFGSAFGGGGGGAGSTGTTSPGGVGGVGALRITYSKTSTVSVQTGYYTGDGSSAHAITGLGFAPDFVLIKSDTAAGVAMFKTSTMPAANTAYTNGTADNTASGLVLNADGFTLGTLAALNSSNVRYTWIAFAGSNCSSSGTFCVGQYAGNSSSTRTISTGFQPDFVMNKRTNTDAAHFRTASEPANETLFMTAAVRDTTGAYLSSFGTTGFNTGATDNVNAGVYNFVAFKSQTGIFSQGTYTGDGSDNRSITGAGFTPNIAFTKNASNATAANTNMMMNTSSSYGDSSSFMSATANGVDYIQALQSGGMQVGTNVAVNGSGDTYYWFAFGGAPSATATNGTRFKMATGSYTGTAATQSVTGVGFQPDLVIIKDDAANFAVFRTSQMKGDLTQYFASASAGFTGGVTSLDSNGFSLGTSTILNTSGNTYRWEAFGSAWNPETKAGATDFMIGTYTGNGIDNRNISGMPWQPDFVTTKRSGASSASWRSSAQTGDISGYYNATTETADIIQSLDASGFQIGTNAGSNNAGNTFYWFAFKNGVGFTNGTYTGDATDNRNISTVGFQPDMVMIKRSNGFNAVKRSANQTGDTTQYFNNLANVSDRIQALQSNGFQLGGSQTETNASGGTYRYMAWRNASASIVSVSITSDGTVNYGTVAGGGSRSTIDIGDSQSTYNDGTVTEDYNIKTSVPSGWSLGTAAGVDTFVHEYSTNSGAAWTKMTTADSYQTLIANIAAQAAQTFDLRLTAPTSSTSGAQRSITVTIQAVQH
jgi:hypothetical protein